MATTLEIIQGINQAAANAYDGAHDESLSFDGKTRKIGLRREEGHIINDKRVSDGFKVRFNGPNLIVLYQSEIRLKEVTKNGFEDDIASMLQQIASFLKKEYKDITGNALTLTRLGEPSILVQKLSNMRTDVRATCEYKIGGLSDVVTVHATSRDQHKHSDTPEKKAVRDWLALGPKNQRPRNDTRKGK